MTCHPRTVEEVMTTSVVSCDRLTPYKEITRLLAEHRISGLPVLVQGWQVVGIVSETDLLAAQDQAARRQAHVGPPRLTAGELMTAPAVTIPPHSTVAAAVRLMTKHHVRRLPVTGADRQLIGVVSQRDVLSVFLRPDTDISHGHYRRGTPWCRDPRWSCRARPAPDPGIGGPYSARDPADLGCRRSSRRCAHPALRHSSW
jgi:CBS domain-containing protein